MTRRWLVIAAGGLLSLAAATSVLAASGAVNIAEQNDKYLFTPAKTYVNVGESVSWKNGTDAPHTVTSDSGSELASSTVATGTTFSHTFSTAGTFAYHCTVHPYMTGEIVVLAAGVTPPPTDTTTTRVPAPGSQLGTIALLLALAGGASLLLARRMFRAGRS